MSLHIRNEEAQRLARELADARGTSLTEAVTEALRQTVRAEHGGADEARLLAEVGQIQDFLAGIPDRDAQGNALTPERSPKPPGPPPPASTRRS